MTDDDGCHEESGHILAGSEHNFNATKCAPFRAGVVRGARSGGALLAGAERRPVRTVLLCSAGRTGNLNFK